MKRRARDPMWTYVAYSYAAFWAIILLLGGLASMVFGAPPAAMTAISILGSWSPTIVLLLMLSRLKPGISVGEFYRRAFREPLKISMIAAILVLIFGIFAVAVGLLSAVTATPVSAAVALPSALGLTLVVTALQGPSGEESGWRGYLRPELEERYGFVRGNLILGLVWAFWHAPLWFLASEYGGSQAVLYAISNIVVLTSLTFIMAILMERNDNLFVAFWIHFCFNLSLRFFEGGAYFFLIISGLYAAVAWALLRYLHSREPKPSPTFA